MANGSRLVANRWAQPAGLHQPPRQVRGFGQHLLAVVEHDQALLIAEVVGDPLRDRFARDLLQPERSEGRTCHPCSVGRGGQVDEPHPAREPIERRTGDLDREPGLATPAGSGEGQEPALLEQVARHAEFLIATDERGQCGGEVVP